MSSSRFGLIQSPCDLHSLDDGRLLMCLDLGVEHLQQQFGDGDAAVAVQSQESLHSSVGGLTQEGEAHQQSAHSTLLSAGHLVLL